MPNDVIEIRDLRKTYSDGFVFKKRFEALKGVTLSIRPGEVFGLLGPNGAGKTTLIKILLGIISPSGGLARVLDQKAGSMAARMRIGYLPENLNVPKHLTGVEALRLYARLNRLPESIIRQRQDEMFFRVGLTGKEKGMVKKYSKGMRQRLGLAQAMIHDPEVLVMDEPTDGLDPVGRSQIREIINSLKAQGKTVFLNSHILQEVEMICDRVAILVNGQLSAVGSTRQLAQQLEHVDAPIALHMQLTGDREAILQVTQTYQKAEANNLKESLELGPGFYEFQCIIKDQSEQDDMIDRLRSVGVSVVSVMPKRPKLEDVFFRMVEGSNPTDEVRS